MKCRKSVGFPPYGYGLSVIPPLKHWSKSSERQSLCQIVSISSKKKLFTKHIHEIFQKNAKLLVIKTPFVTHGVVSNREEE